MIALQKLHADPQHESVGVGPELLKYGFGRVKARVCGRETESRAESIEDFRKPVSRHSRTVPSTLRKCWKRLCVASLAKLSALYAGGGQAVPAEKHLPVVGCSPKRKPLLCDLRKRFRGVCPEEGQWLQGKHPPSLLVLMGSQEGRQPRREPLAVASFCMRRVSFPFLGRNHGRCNLDRAKQIRDQNFRFGLLRVSGEHCPDHGWGLWHGVKAMSMRQEHNVELSALLVQDLCHGSHNANSPTYPTMHGLLVQGLGRRMNCASVPKQEVAPRAKASEAETKATKVIPNRTEEAVVVLVLA